MAYIWNRFRGRNTHRDVTGQGSDFKNARSEFVNGTEGAFTADVNKYIPPLFGVFEDDPSPTQAGSGNAVTYGALALQLEDELPAQAATIVDDEYALALVAPVAPTPAAAIQNDEPAIVIITDDSPTDALVAALARSALPAANDSDEISFVVEADTDWQPAVVALAPSAAPSSADEDAPSFVVEEDYQEPSNVIDIRRYARGIDADDESTVVVLDEEFDGSLATGAPQTPRIVDADDGEQAFAVDEDGGGDTALVVGAAQTARIVDADDESAVVAASDGDDYSPQQIGARLDASIPANIDEDAFATAIDDSDGEIAAIVARALTPRIDDPDDGEMPFPAPPPPTPGRISTVLVGGGAVEGEIEEETAHFCVYATKLDVEVRATMLLVKVVERGNLVVFVAQFVGDPTEVHFSYIRPGERAPVVDAGFGSDESKIQRVSPGVYTYVVDTEGFSGGKIQWHFWGSGDHQASAFGEVVVPDRPAQLL